MRTICWRRSLIPSTVCGIVESSATCARSLSTSDRRWALSERAAWTSPMLASSLRERTSTSETADSRAATAVRNCVLSMSICSSTCARS